MTIYKKISLYFALLALFQLTNCEDKQTDKSKTYPQMSTATYDYKVDINEEPAQEGTDSHEPEVISDDTFTNYVTFGIGLEREKVTEEIQGDIIITTTETWTRKTIDPRIALPVAAGVAGASYIAMNYEGLKKQSQKILTNLSKEIRSLTEDKGPQPRKLTQKELDKIKLRETDPAAYILSLKNDLPHDWYQKQENKVRIRRIIGFEDWLKDNPKVKEKLEEAGLLEKYGGYVYSNGRSEYEYVDYLFYPQDTQFKEVPKSVDSEVQDDPIEAKILRDFGDNDFFRRMIEAAKLIEKLEGRQDDSILLTGNPWVDDLMKLDGS
jgi:hypothetical protein